jgi:hypothetical protein
MQPLRSDARTEYVVVESGEMEIDVLFDALLQV